MENTSTYGKRPLWQWIGIYVVIGAVVYGLIYYFAFAKKGMSGYVQNPPPSSQQQTSSPTTMPTTPSANSPQSENTVTLTADGFSPATLTIKAGSTVMWENKSGSDATVNSNPHPIHTDYPPLNLGTFPDGGTLSLAFDKPGTYRYHNHLNPSQTGTIIVQ